MRTASKSFISNKFCGYLSQLVVLSHSFNRNHLSKLPPSIPAGSHPVTHLTDNENVLWRVTVTKQNKFQMVAHAYNSSTSESPVLGHPELQKEFKFRLATYEKIVSKQNKIN